MSYKHESYQLYRDGQFVGEINGKVFAAIAWFKRMREQGANVKVFLFANGQLVKEMPEDTRLWV